MSCATVVNLNDAQEKKRRRRSKVGRKKERLNMSYTMAVQQSHDADLSMLFGRLYQQMRH